MHGYQAGEIVVAFQISAAASPEVLTVGRENTKVVVIDNFLDDLTDLRRNAGDRSAFGVDGKTSYPGVRCALPIDYVEEVLVFIRPLLSATFEVPAESSANAELAYYSLLTSRASELEVLQRLPHFDTNKKNYYAVLHYLNEGPFGGTGFFRHRPTGFERISQDRRDIFLQSASAFMAVRGMPEPKYISESTNHFELFAQVAYKPNRLVVYPGSLLHSGLVSDDVDVSDDPKAGRLTANIFIDIH